MISVVIPAFNEEGAIADTVTHVRKVLGAQEGCVFEVVVVDDGSSDRTAELAEAAGARLVRKVHNVGYGHSLKLGIAAAQYDIIVITDADGTYPIDRIPELLDIYAKGYDMVVAERTGDHYRESALKQPLRAVLRALVEFTAGRRIPDPNSGLRVFSRETVMPFFSHLSNTFSFTTSVTLAYMLCQKYVTYVPIPYFERVGKTKVRLFRDSLRTMQYIVQAILYYNPLKLFLALCLALMIPSLLVAFGGVIAGSWPMIGLGAAGFLTSVVVFCVGLLGEQLRQLSVQSQST